MKAVVWTAYGSPDVLQIKEVDRPAPQDHEALIRVRAATVSTPDAELRGLRTAPLFAIFLRLYLGLLRPTRITILGTEFAGEIVSTGKDIRLYHPGDQVYGYSGLRMGAYAEYLCLAENQSGIGGIFAKKPDNLSFEEAAAVPFGGLEALHSVRKANIRPGQKVLIVGAGGSIGTYSVQFARLSGAEVTGVDKPGKLEMLRSIGADHVIDYTTEDFTKNGQTYDAILDTIGKSPFSASLRSLNENGTYLNDNPGLFGGIRMRWAANRTSKKIIPWSAGYSTKNLLALNELIEAGRIKPVIDKRFRLEEIAEAHRYVDSGEKKGNVVVTIQ